MTSTCSTDEPLKAAQRWKKSRNMHNAVLQTSRFYTDIECNVLHAPFFTFCFYLEELKWKFLLKRHFRINEQMAFFGSFSIFFNK